MKKLFPQILVIAVMLFGISFPLVLAYQVEDLNISPGDNDFVLGPGKVELWVEPGEKIIKEFTITNRLGKTMDFKIGIEDMKGSRDPEETVVLLGEEKGPYSLKDYIKPELTEFTLNHGQRMILPVEISIPPDAEPGGLYGSMLVSTSPPQVEGGIEGGKAKGQISLISRLGTLFFIRVKGEAREEGSLKDFTVEKSLYEKGSIPLNILYENNGDVHLNPYGVIEIRNILGRKIDEIEVDPYFTMPDSVRLREVKWDRELLFGKYTASLSLNRGYQDKIDQKSISFWVVPWKIILSGLSGIIVMVSLLVWIVSRFEIRRKGKRKDVEQKKDSE